MRPTELERHSYQSLQQGSKSFALASLIFSPETQTDVAHLYSWCRHCDDITDGSVLGFYQDFHQGSQPLLPERVDQLKEMTARAKRDQPETDLGLPFIAFGKVMRKYQIPDEYAQDLLEGMHQDSQGVDLNTFADLKQYCYRVAGTVGLMMCHLMGLKTPQALSQAVDLGIALQLTNIARDIGDDFRVQRIYLPREWLQEVQIPPHALLAMENRPKLEDLAKRLLKTADHYYASGVSGLIHLPWRCALAVAVAASVYRRIGLCVLRQRSQAWQTRVCLSKVDQSLAIFRGLWIFLKTLPQRLKDPRSIQPISELWRYS